MLPDCVACCARRNREPLGRWTGGQTGPPGAQSSRHGRSGDEEDFGYESSGKDHPPLSLLSSPASPSLPIRSLSTSVLASLESAHDLRMHPCLRDSHSVWGREKAERGCFQCCTSSARRCQALKSGRETRCEARARARERSAGRREEEGEERETAMTAHGDRDLQRRGSWLERERRKGKEEGKEGMQNARMSWNRSSGCREQLFVGQGVEAQHKNEGDSERGVEAEGPRRLRRPRPNNPGCMQASKQERGERREVEGAPGAEHGEKRERECVCERSSNAAAGAGRGPQC